MPKHAKTRRDCRSWRQTACKGLSAGLGDVPRRSPYEVQHPTPIPDKTGQPLKNATPTHEKPDKTGYPGKMGCGGEEGREPERPWSAYPNLPLDPRSEPFS